MAGNKQNNGAAMQTENHQSLAENIGISENLEDFGGGRGQAAGVQESVSSQDQFDNDVTQLADEKDFANKVTPREPFDYYDKKEDKEE